MMDALRMILGGAILCAALGISPAHAGRVCGNALADGRFIVQGPLVDEFGESCAIAVVPRSPGDFSRLTVIDGAQFSDQTIILSPPFAHRPRRLTVVEPSRLERPGRSPDFDARRFAPPAEPQQPSVPFTTGPIGPFTTGPVGPLTTGPLGPLTTFSNSPSGRVGHH
jgi:hypothetical protein